MKRCSWMDGERTFIVLPEAPTRQSYHERPTQSFPLGRSPREGFQQAPSSTHLRGRRFLRKRRVGRHGPLGNWSLPRSMIGLGRTARRSAPTSEHGRARRLIGPHPRLPSLTPPHPCPSEIGRAYSFSTSHSSPINPQAPNSAKFSI